METQTALVGADGVVELEAVAGIDLHVALVVDPYHLEREAAVGFHDPLRNAVGFEFGVLVVGLLDGHQYFAHGLQIFAFAGVLPFEFGHQIVDIHRTVVF